MIRVGDEFPHFGARLARFMELKSLDADTVAGLYELDLAGVIEGSVPSEPLLERLAPALGLHIQDVFVVAGVVLPEDLTVLDPAAGISAVNIAFAAVSLPAERAQELRQLIQALPQEARRKPALPPKRYGPGPASFLLGMLDNRSLARYHTAKALYLGTRGGLYLSEVTVQHALAHDKQVTPDMFAGFARVLGIPVGDLAALTGFDLPPGVLPERHVVPTVVAELLWDVRRLSSKQARYVADVARSMMKDGPRPA